MIRLVLDENMPAIAQWLAMHPCEVVTKAGRSLTQDDLTQAQGLLVRSVTQVNHDLLHETPISFVGSATIGTDHLDIEYLNSHRIRWTNSPGCNADSVVDYVFSCLATLYLERGLPFLERRFAVVGCGNVGGRLVARLKALGCQVHCYDPPKAEREVDFQSCSFEEVLEADIICLHAPLNSGSRHLFDAKAIRAIKSGAVLLNAGRGPVIDNQALLQRLKTTGDILALLDVWEQEPEPSLELVRHCYLASPHIAGYSLEGKTNGSLQVYLALCDHFGWAPKVTQPLGMPAIAQMQLGDTHLANICRAILAVYSVRADDSRFRLNFDGTSASFDGLRKAYVERREFSATQVLPTHATLTALGFKS